MYIYNNNTCVGTSSRYTIVGKLSKSVITREGKSREKRKKSVCIIFVYNKMEKSSWIFFYIIYKYIYIRIYLVNGNLLTTIRIYYVLMLYNRLMQVDYKKAKTYTLRRCVFFLDLFRVVPMTFRNRCRYCLQWITHPVT